MYYFFITNVVFIMLPSVLIQMFFQNIQRFRVAIGAVSSIVPNMTISFKYLKLEWAIWNLDQDVEKSVKKKIGPESRGLVAILKIYRRQLVSHHLFSISILFLA